MRALSIPKVIFMRFLLMVAVARMSMQSPIGDTGLAHRGGSRSMCWRKCGPWGPHHGGGGTGYGGGGNDPADGGNVGSTNEVVSGSNTDIPSRGGSGGWGTSSLCPAGQRPVDVDACTTCCR